MSNLKPIYIAQELGLGLAIVLYTEEKNEEKEKENFSGH